MQKRALSNCGVLFLVAGIGMLATEYAGGPSLDIPDVYALSNISSATTVTSTCSSQGSEFHVPSALAITVALPTSVGGGIGVGTSTASVTNGIGANGVTAEESLALISTTFTSGRGSNEEADDYRMLRWNGFRMRRDMQCLGYDTPYAKVTMKLSAGSVGLNSIATSNSANSNSAPSYTNLTTTQAYIKGGSGTANVIAVDTELAELIIGGDSNMAAAFGWSLEFTREISIDTASAPTTPSITTESQLANVTF